MSERTPPSRSGLEQSLDDVGQSLVWPPTPDLAPSVRMRLHQRPVPATPRWPLAARWVRLGIVGVAMALVAAVVLTVLPGVGTAIADRLGVRGIILTWLPNLPTLATPLPSPTSGADLGLGARVTLTEAQGRVTFPIMAPRLPEFSEPDAVYVGDLPASGQVSLVYAARNGLPAATVNGVGLLLTQFRGGVDPGLFRKGMGAGVALEQVAVAGMPGFWISGQPHALLYQDAAGKTHEERVRLAGNTLIWERDGFTLRLESALDKAAALRIADSVR